ncbi:MAG TPA: cupin domain-containing protein [Chloroflexota bacterium]|nr:cupin domain-containing protein [Chloroflexota bacterium]
MAIAVDREKALTDFYAHADKLALAPHWLQGNTKPHPRGDVRPWLWRWKDLRAALFQAAEVMPLGGDTERRALTMKNPTLQNARGTTRTLVSAVQLIYPGEEAPSHRHTNAALRFIIEGSGAYTVVNGQPCSMEPGDFLLTPSWAWHGHSHEGQEPMIWLDVLDAPLIGTMDWRFFEEFGSETKQLQPSEEPLDVSVPRYAAGGLMPLARRHPGVPHSPLFSYKWPQTRAALDALTQADMTPFDGLAMVYSDPATGGPVMPTIDCSIQLLPAGHHTQAHRHTTNTIYHVAEGRGFSILDGVRFEWEKADTFCVPNWVMHEHASVDGDAILFAASDLPILEKLGVYREDALPGGRQEITGTFEG